jgi:membrane protease YdiL (CAAX protease family)
MGTGSWRDRGRALVEILLAAGLLTEFLSLALLAPFPSISNPLGSVKALAAFTTLSSVLLLILLGLLQRLRGESLLAFWPGHRGAWGREALRGALWVPAIFAGSYALKFLFRHLAPGIYSGETNVLEEMMRSPADLLLFLFVAIFTGGIKEEVQRAFVIRRFEAGWGPAWLGALLFAIYFGLGHRVQGADEAIIAGGLGLAWGLLYIRRGSIAAPAVSHGLYDALELVRYYLSGPMRYL